MHTKFFILCICSFCFVCTLIPIVEPQTIIIINTLLFKNHQLQQASSVRSNQTHECSGSSSHSVITGGFNRSASIEMSEEVEQAKDLDASQMLDQSENSLQNTAIDECLLQVFLKQYLHVLFHTDHLTTQQ